MDKFAWTLIVICTTAGVDFVSGQRSPNVGQNPSPNPCGNPQNCPPRKVIMAANDFLISKWKIWYKLLDVNHDGTISMADEEEFRNTFLELHNFEAEKKEMVMENFKIWWNKYVFRRQTSEISEQQFVDALHNDFMTNKVKFFANMQTCFNEFFDVIDTNKDRSISEDEFFYAFIAYGHENVALVTNFFQAYNQVNEVVPLKDIVASWVDFATSTDSSKPSIVKSAFGASV